MPINFPHVTGYAKPGSNPYDDDDDDTMADLLGRAANAYTPPAATRRPYAPVPGPGPRSPIGRKPAKLNMGGAGNNMLGFLFEHRAADVTPFKRFIFIGGGLLFLIMSGIFTTRMIPAFFPYWRDFLWLPVVMFTVTEFWSLSTKSALGRCFCLVAFFFDFLFNALALHYFAGYAWQPGTLWTWMLNLFAAMLAVCPELLLRDGTGGIASKFNYKRGY